VASVPTATEFVHNDDYRVFLTQGDSFGLHVSSKTASGFTVRKQQGGKSNVGFDYRVVAKRKDIAVCDWNRSTCRWRRTFPSP
jgi:hypothetical protein